MDIDTRFSYYDILEVDPHCPQHEITSAYERARTTYSGDNPAIYTMFNVEEARDLLKLIDEAYSVLGNKTLRALYDEKIGQNRPSSSLTFESLQAESKVVFNETPKKSSAQKLDFIPDPEMEKSISEKKSWTGEDLKKVREYKKFTLDHLSEITRISAFYINSIESIDHKGLPASVYVRGYVAQIAKILGLDERKVCDSYMKSFKESLERK